MEHHYGCSFLFYFSYCYSSYYFSDFSLDFDYFDSFVVFLDHLLHDQNHRVSYLVALVSSDVYRLELEQQQQLVLYGSQQLAPVQVLSLLVLLPVSGAVDVLVLLLQLVVCSDLHFHVRTQHFVQPSVLLHAL